ncbi:response regulator [Prolixibacteraceae bacterium JC049]|nr:response regulator [Prolixibacteraceae bacterium JC049]
MKQVIITILVVLSFGGNIRAKDFIKVKNITYTQGLSENTTSSIAQDTLGYIWIGTREGLNRYDGYSCKKYFSSTKQKGSLRASRIFNLYIDKHSNFWVKHDAGIDEYQPNTDSFAPLNIEFEGKSITWFNQMILMSGFTWISTNQFGLLALHPKTKQVAKRLFPNKAIHRICQQNDSLLWVYFDQQLHLANTNSNQVIKTISPTFDDSIIDMVYFNNKLWIYSYSQLWVYQNNKFSKFDEFALAQNVSPKELIPKVDEILITNMVKHNDQLWISTDGNGIFILDGKQNSEIKNITTNSSEQSIATNAIRCLYSDKDGNMWIGTVHKGVHLISQNQKLFYNQHYSSHTPNTPYGNISNFLEDKANNLWAASFEGLCLMDRKTMKIKRRIARDAIINSITINWNGEIFLGTYNKGLLKYNPSNQALDVINPKQLNLKRQSINALLTDNTGNVWIGANKLYCLNKSTGEITTVFPDKIIHVTSLFQDKDNRFWIGTANGLFLYSKEGNQLERYSTQKSSAYQISHNLINCIYADRKGNIWIGTNGGGLNKITRTNHEISYYRNDQQLSSSVIHGITEDNNGNIWYTTNNELIKLNPLNNQSYTFDYTDGLLNNQFIDEALFLSESGIIYCGGEKGIDYFYPNSIKINTTPPKVIISTIIFNSDKSSNIEKHGYYQSATNDTLELKYNESSFGFEFTGIDFTNTQKIKYQYQLEGIDQSWITTHERRNVTYGHVPPGTYTFRVKAANSDGIWSKVQHFTVVVKPPFAATPLAYAIYFLITALLLYIVYRYLLERKLLKNRVDFEARERKRIEELNQLKLRLFTHISHEFRTPLSLILAPVQDLLKRNSKESTNTKGLQTIEKNAQKLQTLVNQVLEIRKIESGAIQITKTPVEMVSFIKSSCESFNYWAKQKNIQLSFNTEIKKLVLNIDQGLIEKVIYNLLSNALKYTPEGFITVQIKQEGNSCIIEVTDSGIGISKQHIEKLFQLFYRVDETQQEAEGSGIGLALSKELIELHEGQLTVDSKPDVGSTFTVRLPLPTVAIKEQSITTVSINTPIESRSEKHTLLLAEDNHELRQFVFEKLSEQFNVIQAINGEQAYSLAQEHQPSLILSDVMMPEMDGWQLCEAIKTDINTSHIPIILLTALSENEHAIKGLDLGADAYIAKPFNIDHLISQVNNIIKNREQLVAKYKQQVEETVDPNQFTELDKELMEKVHKVTTQHINDPSFSVQALSDSVGMSRSNLHHKLKALCDLSPSELIIQIRLKQAVKLLKEKKYAMNEIADMTGFSTASHFSRTFKKQFGGTPSDFLKGQLTIHF